MFLTDRELLAIQLLHAELDVSYWLFHCCVPNWWRVGGYSIVACLTDCELLAIPLLRA